MWIKEAMSKDPGLGIGRYYVFKTREPVIRVVRRMAKKAGFAVIWLIIGVYSLGENL